MDLEQTFYINAVIRQLENTQKDITLRGLFYCVIDDGRICKTQTLKTVWDSGKLLNTIYTWDFRGEGTGSCLGTCVEGLTIYARYVYIPADDPSRRFSF